MKRIPYVWQCAGALFLLIATASCGGPISTVTPAAPASSPSAAMPSQPAAHASAQPASAAASSTQAPSASHPSASGPVSLQVASPQDGAVVNTPQLQVSGAASPGAVVTVNDNVLIVGADGSFSTTISLDMGPNLVEIIASNDSGDSKTLDLTVTYQP